MTTKQPSLMDSIDPKKIITNRDKLTEQLESVESEAVIAATALDEQIKHLKKRQQQLRSKEPAAATDWDEHIEQLKKMRQRLRSEEPAAAAWDEHVEHLKKARQQFRSEEPAPFPIEKYENTRRHVDWTLLGFVAVISALFGIVATASLKS